MSTATSIAGIISIFCTVWVIYEVWAVNKNAETLHKVLWTLGALFFSVLTAIVYYLVVKRKEAETV